MASGADVDTRNAGGGVYGKVVRFLVGSGTGVDMGATDEQTPLHLAADDGHEEVVRVLVENVAEEYNSI